MSLSRPPLRYSWVSSDRRVPRLIARPIRRYLDTETAGGVVLLIATAFALVWANSPWNGAYESLLHTEMGFEIGDFAVRESFQHWVNDGLMALFFFVVGLEIKRELVAGELNDARKAALPAIAAIGGMVVPALIYMAFNAGGSGSAGWGIPMATDIAFAVGVLSLVGRGLPSGLKVFLLSLAIVDDIGAILVIAIFYTGDLSMGWLAIAGAGLLVVVLLRRLHVWWTPIYAVVGVGIWLATLESGVHATIAGVALGLLAPALPADPGGAKDVFSEAEKLMKDPSPEEVRAVSLQAQESVSVAERLELVLHPYTSFVIIPIFAFANAGVSLNADVFVSALNDPITLGIVFGLVVGKLVGVSLASYIAVRLGWGSMPEGANWGQMIGVAAVAGVGFTVSLFIAGLAFSTEFLTDEAKVGIMVGSLIATIVGAVLLKTTTRTKGSREAGSLTVEGEG